MLFAACVALHGFVLGDELIASLYAMEMLREMPGFEESHVRSARRTLALAFSSYAVGFLARALLLTQWPLVVELTRDAMVPPFATLTAFGTVLAAALSVVLVVGALTRVLAKHVKVPDRVLTVGVIAMLLANPAVVALLLLVWNTHADPSFGVVGDARAAPGARLLRGRADAADGPRGRVRAQPVHEEVDRRRHASLGAAPGATTPRARRSARVGNLAIAELIAKAETSPPLEHRLLQVLHLSYIPLLIVVWLA